MVPETDSVPDASWDHIIAGFDDGYHEQTACYAKLHWRARDSHLLLRADGVAIAGARVAVFSLPTVHAGVAFLRFGPFWRRSGQIPDPENYRTAIHALVEEYCDRRGYCLTVMPRPNPVFYPLECEMLEDAGFSIRRQPRDPNRYLVDLSLEQDALMRGLEQKWRYNLRQALANNLDIRLCEDEADTRTFEALYRSMMARKNFSSTTPVHLSAELQAGLPAELRPHLFMAFQQGQPIVGAMIGVFGDTAYYMFGASSQSALTLKAGYALQWWIVQWLRQRAVRWYDLGGEAGEQGLRQFKKGLVGKSGTVLATKGEYDRWTRPSARVAADLIYSLRAAQRVFRQWRDRG